MVGCVGGGVVVAFVCSVMVFVVFGSVAGLGDCVELGGSMTRAFFAAMCASCAFAMSTYRFRI